MLDCLLFLFLSYLVLCLCFVGACWVWVCLVDWFDLVFFIFIYYKVVGWVGLVLLCLVGVGLDRRWVVGGWCFWVLGLDVFDGCFGFGVFCVWVGVG